MAKKGALAAEPKKKSTPRDPREMDRYKRNQEILKKAKPGTPEYDRAVKGLERVGTMYGLNWKQHIPGGYKAPADSQAPNTTPQPAPNVPSTVINPPQVSAPSTANPAFNAPNASMANQPTLEGQDALASNYGAGLYEQAIGQAGRFDPNTFQQNYNPQFQQGMQRAYDTVYNEFDRRNSQRMSQEQQQMEQSIVERGLDPTGDAAQQLRMQLSQRQADERQGAQNAAWQAAQGYQQQGFNQAQATSLMPGEIFGQFAAPWMQQMGQRGQSQQSYQDYGQALNLTDADLRGKMALGAQDLATQQALLQQKGQIDERLLNLGGQWDLKKIKSTPRGGGGGGDPYGNWENQYYANMVANGYNQPNQPSMGNAAVQGFAQGAGTGLVNALGKK